MTHSQLEQIKVEQGYAQIKKDLPIKVNPFLVHRIRADYLRVSAYYIYGVDSMGKLVHRHNEYIVIEDDYKKGHHIIINTKGKYENHGHVKYLGSCKKLLKLMDKKIIPDNDYLRGTVLKISLDEKYKDKIKSKIEKDKQKPHYININKGVRR